MTTARPIQAAAASAIMFAAGAALPLIVALLSPPNVVGFAVASSSLLFLALLGAVGARAGGARAPAAVARVVFWGAFALAATAGIGRLFGAIV